MRNNVHYFCPVRCNQYPNCACYNAAKNAVKSAADQAGAETMKNWNISYDDEKGVINIKNLRIDEEMREQ